MRLPVGMATQQPVVRLLCRQLTPHPLAGYVTGVGHADLDWRAWLENPSPLSQSRLDQLPALVLQHMIGSQHRDRGVDEGKRVEAADHLGVVKAQDVRVDLVIGVGLLASANLELHWHRILTGGDRAVHTLGMSDAQTIPEGEAEGEGWAVQAGTVVRRPADREPWKGGAEDLTYDNPFNLEMERVWFDDRIVYAIDLGEVEVDVERVKVAQEYQLVYSVELDDEGKLKAEPERVPGQYNIYDSVPGMEEYSPLWQFNYVVVPREYRANLLRSARACQESGYRIVRSTVVEN